VFITIAIGLFTVSCNQVNEKAKKVSLTTALQANEKVQKTMNDFKLVYIEEGAEDILTNNDVNTAHQAWCDALVKTGKFILSLQDYFFMCDSNFIKYPQFDDVPFGFDGDLIIKMNDYYSLLNNIDKLKLFEKKFIGKTAVLKFGRFEYYTITFELSLFKGKWLIDKINGDFPMEIDHTYFLPPSHRFKPM
jgi:hypothetical protein